MNYVSVTCTQLNHIKWKSVSEIQSFSEAVIVVKASVFEYENQTDFFKCLLSIEEKERANRFLYSNDRNRFILTRGILRLLLSQYQGISAEEITFEKGKNGKPFYISSQYKPLCFNVSHSKDKIIIALGTSEVGVDLEKVEPDFLFQDVSTQYFSPVEQMALQRVAKPLVLFYELWTRKEALLKATSVGLIDQLAQVSCLLGENFVDPTLISTDKNWLVQSFFTDDSYVASIASDPKMTPAFYNFDFNKIALSKILKSSFP